MSYPSRRFMFCGICFIACGLATLASAQPPAEKGFGKKGGADRVEIKTYDFKDAKKEIEYALFVPTKYDKEKKTPLVVALHGLNGTPQGFIRSKGLTQQAEKYGYIVVAPMGYNTKGWYGSTGPSGRGGKGKGKTPDKGAEQTGDNPPNLGELSEKDVMNVVEIVRKNYNIDEKRMYLIGHSMGGGGTWFLGTKYPEMWAGLGPIAPAVFGQPKDLDKLKNMSVIVIQGDMDPLVKVEGTRKWVAKLKELNITHEYVEIAGGDHGSIMSTAMPTIFEFFEKNRKKPEEK